MRYLPLILIAVLVVFSAGWWARGRAIPATIAEDDERWDCHTMGNRVCGPTVVEHEGHYDVLRGDGSVWLSEFDAREEAQETANRLRQ